MVKQKEQQRRNYGDDEEEDGSDESESEAEVAVSFSHLYLHLRQSDSKRIISHFSCAPSNKQIPSPILTACEFCYDRVIAGLKVLQAGRKSQMTVEVRTETAVRMRMTVKMTLRRRQSAPSASWLKFHLECCRSLPVYLNMPSIYSLRSVPSHPNMDAISL